MPHRCTKCGAIYSDGDSVILTGCPECKWNKFLYVKAEDVGADAKAAVKPTAAEVKFDAEAYKQDSWNIDKRIKEKEMKENDLKAIDSVLEDIDRALESDEVNKKELDTDRVDSIRILDSGSYELNLGSIMEQDEIIVGIKEEGQYAIDLPVILQQSGKSSKKKKSKK